ncbi:MAG: hypothetical protein N3B21_08710 [Clostridia bacterium]|nr:hypothetical protein [Clostridia bacterium]
MNILMLGNSFSGKTTYMVSTYGLMQKPIKGFTLKAINGNDHEMFTKLFSNIKSSNKYPFGTDKRNVYKFHLMYHSRRVLDFSWKDYRGGMINESSQGNDDIEQLKKDIKTSDAIMMFFEADALKNNESERTRVRKILSIVNQYVGEIDKPLSIIILLTKYDLVMDDLEINQNFERLLSPLESFLMAVEQNDNIVAHVIPVSCTKRGIMHIDFPIMALMYHGIIKEYVSLADQVKKHSEKAQTYVQKSGIFDSLVSLVFREPSYYDLASKEAAKLKEKMEIAKDMEHVEGQLKAYLDEYKMFESINIEKEHDIFAL